MFDKKLRHAYQPHEIYAMAPTIKRWLRENGHSEKDLKQYILYAKKVIGENLEGLEGLTEKQIKKLIYEKYNGDRISDTPRRY